eukprot:CAMPEP_0183351616 /NCGR_PEP_ID=MMETSP0164_2-20130417/26124_1 /TAXON_ID=221442 /ORGANISM="Coccolithus pelagicus ssp braarudi, Strain PLY182g" /LENGTH=291 /DNA_ID=CAMNT_0025523849 /DNA_START=208 /DNA_END=1084 /DNA_ORIENTATION=-
MQLSPNPSIASGGVITPFAVEQTQYDTTVTALTQFTDIRTTQTQTNAPSCCMNACNSASYPSAASGSGITPFAFSSLIDLGHVFLVCGNELRLALLKGDLEPAELVTGLVRVRDNTSVKTGLRLSGIFLMCSNELRLAPLEGHLKAPDLIVGLVSTALGANRNGSDWESTLLAQLPPCSCTTHRPAGGCTLQEHGGLRRRGFRRGSPGWYSTSICPFNSSTPTRAASPTWNHDPGKSNTGTLLAKLLPCICTAHRPARVPSLQEKGRLRRRGHCWRSLGLHNTAADASCAN